MAPLLLERLGCKTLWSDSPTTLNKEEDTTSPTQAEITSIITSNKECVTPSYAADKVVQGDRMHIQKMYSFMSVENILDEKCQQNVIS